MGGEWEFRDGKGDLIGRFTKPVQISSYDENPLVTWGMILGGVVGAIVGAIGGVSHYFSTNGEGARNLLSLLAWAVGGIVGGGAAGAFLGAFFGYVLPLAIGALIVMLLIMVLKSCTF